MSRKLNQVASKDTLTQWVSLSLRKALTESNVKKGFSATGIWPLNQHVVDNMLAPSELFHTEMQEGEAARTSIHDDLQGGLFGEQLHRRPSLPGSHEEDDQDDFDHKHGVHEHGKDDGNHELEDQGDDGDQDGPESEDDEDDLDQDVEDQDGNEHSDQEGGHGHRPPINSDDMASDFAMQLVLGVKHFFVNCNQQTWRSLKKLDALILV
jgi:hypothetical protein